MAKEVTRAEAIAGEISFTVIAFIFLFLRLYVRVYILSQFSLQDALITLAFLCFFGNTIGDIYARKWGFWDRRIMFHADGSPPDFDVVIQDKQLLKKWFKMMYSMSPLYFIVLYSIKTAFFLMYMKLFPRDMVRLRRVLYSTAVVTVFGFIVIICMQLLWCQPIRANWSLNKDVRCLSWAATPPYFFATGFHIVSDIFVYALPFFIIPRLYATASRRKVVGVILLFSLGLLCLVCTVGRIVYSGLVATQPTLAIWSAAEMCTAVVVGCCPPLRWLWTSRHYYMPNHGNRSRVGSEPKVEGAGRKRDWIGLRKGSGSKPRSRDVHAAGVVDIDDSDDKGEGGSKRETLEDIQPGTIEKGTVGTVGTWTIEGSALNTVGTIDNDGTRMSVDVERGLNSGGLGAPPPRYKQQQKQSRADKSRQTTSSPQPGRSSPGFQLHIEETGPSSKHVKKSSSITGLWNKFKSRSNNSSTNHSNSSKSTASNATTTFGGGSHTKRDGGGGAELSTFGGSGKTSPEDLRNHHTYTLNQQQQPSPSSPSFPHPTPIFRSTTTTTTKENDPTIGTTTTSRATSPYPYGNPQRQQSAGFGFLSTDSNGMSITQSRITVSSHGADSFGDDVRGSYASLTFGTGTPGPSTPGPEGK